MTTVKIVSQATGKVLDVPGGDPADGVRIQQFTDNGGANQHWQLVSKGEDLFKIVSQATGKVLDVPGGDPADGVPVQQFTDADARELPGTNQHWRFLAAGPDLFKIVSQATGKVLDVPGGDPADGVRIQQFTDNGGANQHWQLVAVAAAGLSSATVSFHTNDEDKDGDSHVTVTVRQSDGVVAARVDGDFGGFPNDSDRGPFSLTIANASARRTLEGGTVTVRIDPNGNDTWRFNFTLDLGFEDGTHLLSAHDGVELSQDVHEQTFGI